jgi:hypothetical protein
LVPIGTVASGIRFTRIKNDFEVVEEDDEGTSTLDSGFSMNKIWDDCHLECYLDKEQNKTLALFMVQQKLWRVACN